MKLFAGILAAGSGVRMASAPVPKQFLRIGGIPVFIRTLQTFLSVNMFEKVIIAINEDWADMYHSMLEEYNIDPEKVDLVVGGDTRFKSITNVVRRADELADGDRAYFIVHDAARLFLPAHIIRENIEAVTRFDVVTTSVPAIDTFIETVDGINATFGPDRSKTWNDQGPQTFEVSRFLEYESRIPREKLNEYAEVGKLFLENGCREGIVRGDWINFKLTTDLDVKYADFLIREGIV